MIAGAVAVLMLVVAAVSWVYPRHATPAGVSSRPSATTPSKAPRVAAVTYEVSGKGRADIQYNDPARTETTSLTDRQLPWRVDLPSHPVSFVRITARRRGSHLDANTVRVLVDGVEVCSNNDGGYPQATCSELVPPL
jgi:hypothetical protein